jgi:hypothetical protein
MRIRKEVNLTRNIIHLSILTLNVNDPNSPSESRMAG